MPDKTDEKKGKFKKGKSGNPLGRPRGTRNKATVLAEQLFENDVEAICRQAIEQAKKGNMQRELQNSIWDPICAFGIGFAFFASCLLSVKYVNLRRKRTDAKIIKLGLQSEFCNSLYKQ